MKRTIYNAKQTGIILCLLLTGCATQTRVETVTVRVPYAVPCAVSAGPEPNPIWTAIEKAARPDLFSLGGLLWAAYVQERARNAELRAALKGCGG